MRIQDPKLIIHPLERDVYASALEPVRRLASELECREQSRFGGTRETARSRLARRVGIMPGTLYNLARDRLKRFDADVRERLVQYAVKDLEREIARLELDLAVARALGGAEDRAAFRATAEGLLKRAQTLRDEFSEEPE